MFTICCDLKTREECYIDDGLVFIPYDKPANAVIQDEKELEK